jgi:hypothetical protein
MQANVSSQGNGGQGRQGGLVVCIVAHLLEYLRGIDYKEMTPMCEFPKTET